MNERTDLSYMVGLYMALADQTRLRLLSQMYRGEVCVADFTDALGDSQPKISRHLAYLRNAGIVNTRRDGKWIHYSIRWPDDERGEAMLRAALNWMTGPEISGSVDSQPVRDVAPRQIESVPEVDVYDDPYMNEEEYGSSGSAHNELEEFLL